jgi:hypothetical protein
MVQIQKISRRLVFLILFIFIFNLGAMKLYWYQSIWWFDMPMHFIGGVVIVFLLVYLLHSYFNKKELKYILNENKQNNKKIETMENTIRELRVENAGINERLANLEDAFLKFKYNN